MRYVSLVALALGLLIVTPVVAPRDWSAAEAKKSAKKNQRSNQVAPSKKPATVTPGSVKSDPASVAQNAANTAANEPLRPRQFAPANLTISTDKTVYKAGDLITIGVSADAACDLTLIGIDSEDFATVLFPNDFQPNNQLNSGTPVSIPMANAPFQLRVNSAGIETLLGICSEPGFRPLGINADYERNRFTQLGDWPTFSVNKEAREKQILSDAKEALTLAKRKRRKLPGPLLPIGDPNGEGRALLLVPVE